MSIGDLTSESFGACLLLSLPEDVFTNTTSFLSPSDICNLSLCCKSLYDLVDSEKIWLVQCELVKILPLVEIGQWRIGISSYKALCRFMVKVMKPLVGIWVCQNPELGNVVYVMPGFLSVVGCRIIPQEVVDPLRIQESQLLWSPVFEIICGFDGSNKFFLHGRDKEDCSCLYPCFAMDIEKSCNVLLLEVEPSRANEIGLGKKDVMFPFCELSFSKRRQLLDIVTSHVGLALSSERLFLISKDDEAVLLERRTMLLKMHKFGGNWNHMNLEDDELSCNPIQVDINEMWKSLSYNNSDENQIQGRASSISSSSETNRLNLQTFLNSGDSVGLSIKACNTKLPTYRGWPIMNETRFALYKLPIKNLFDSQEKYAGLWGGTFGWPLENKPGQALFLLMLIYEESQEYNERVLIGKKILEGTDYVMHPNGSAMFVVKIDSPSFDLFPLDTNGVEIERHSYTGEGIVNGYGFRYPGRKPGSLYVTSKGLLMFVWKETKVVLTLQRLNLEELLKKKGGLCVPPLPPCMNFAYLTNSSTNVFAMGTTS